MLESICRVDLFTVLQHIPGDGLIAAHLASLTSANDEHRFRLSAALRSL